ncbi:MAG: c-type cytochrome [Phormidesmis sp.]
MVAVVIFLWQGSAIFPTKGYAIALTTSPTISDSAPSSAAVLFEQNCAGCHVNGGNVIRRGKNLKKKAMVRNGYSDVDAIAQIITNGKGIMSAYGDRLNEEEIGAIAQYVHEQSEAGW